MFKPSLHCSREQRRRPGWQMNGQEGGVWGGGGERVNECVSLTPLLKNLNPTWKKIFNQASLQQSAKFLDQYQSLRMWFKYLLPPTPLVWALESFLRHNKKFRQDLSPVWELIIVGTLLSYTRPKTSGTVWGEILKRRCDSYWNGRAAKGWNCHLAFYKTS